jgi:TRAP-type C4-dicarboxylate transport system substrate-binding protein
MVLIRRVMLVLWAALASTAVGAGESYELKFATLAPEGSTWMNILADWGRQVEEQSGGRLRFKMYPGGVSGDEPDVLRKIRFGQLQGSAITGHGVGLIYSPARVLEMPFLFRDYAEVDFVGARLVPDLRPGFRDHGFELVGWLEVGFVRFFSKEQIHSIDEMRQRRIWLWQGDPLAEAFFKVSALTPIPLSITDVFTSLSTGLIDTVYAPPLAAIAMQWFTKTPYISDAAMTNGIGALVVDRRFFDRLPADLQQLLRDTGEKTGKRLTEETRRDNERSLEVLKKSGLTFVHWNERDSAQVIELRDRAAKLLAEQGYIPPAIYQQVEGLLEEYRKTHPAPADAPAAR